MHSALIRSANIVCLLPPIMFMALTPRQRPFTHRMVRRATTCLLHHRRAARSARVERRRCRPSAVVFRCSCPGNAAPRKHPPLRPPCLRLNACSAVASSVRAGAALTSRLRYAHVLRNFDSCRWQIIAAMAPWEDRAPRRVQRNPGCVLLCNFSDAHSTAPQNSDSSAAADESHPGDVCVRCEV
jgi:hypothetical protein